MKNQAFALRLRTLLDEAGIDATQPAVARAFGCSVTMAWNYLNGEKLPGMANAIKIATRLGCCVEYLLTGRGPKRPQPPCGDPCASIDVAELSEKQRAILQETVDAFAESNRRRATYCG